LNDRRNRTIHDARLIRKADNAVSRLQVTAKPKVHFGFIPETIEELQEMWREVADQTRRFIAMREKIYDELQASIQKSPVTLLQILPADQPTSSQPSDT
jgi:hypothetical protein